MPSPTNPSATLESAPNTIPEQQVSWFKFYMNHALQDGMTYSNELYRLAKEFRIGDRLEAYQFGCELFWQGVSTLISVSKQRYIVWVSLRDPVTKAWLETPDSSR
ncbi:MAG: hypothetical protein WCA35_14045 [Kovacikia sp.]